MSSPRKVSGRNAGHTDRTRAWFPHGVNVKGLTPRRRQELDESRGRHPVSANLKPAWKGDPDRDALGLFTGYLRPADAVRLGLLDADDPSVDVLSRLLAGPDPWCPFFSSRGLP
jgi:hypothetical protein